jgi:hypothetical protein
MALYTLDQLLRTHALYPGWRMDYDYSRYNLWSVEKIDHHYWLIDPTPGAVEKARGPFETEHKAWLACPKWSRDGGLVVENIMRMVLPKEREIKIFGDLHIYYDENGVMQQVSRMRWRYQTIWYKGSGLDYGHAAVRSHLAYFIRKLKRTGPLPETAETSI